MKNASFRAREYATDTRSIEFKCHLIPNGSFHGLKRAWAMNQQLYEPASILKTTCLPAFDPEGPAPWSPGSRAWYLPWTDVLFHGDASPVHRAPGRAPAPVPAAASAASSMRDKQSRTAQCRQSR